MKNQPFQAKNNTTGKFVFLAVTILIIDQVTKYFAMQKTFIKNTGIIFGLAQNSNQVMIYVSVIAGAIILGLILYSKARHKVFYALILGGIIGNLTDRVIKGYVVDFIEIGFWPVFNVADAAISVSVVILLVLGFFADKKKKHAIKRIHKELKRN